MAHRLNDPYRAPVRAAVSLYLSVSSIFLPSFRCGLGQLRRNSLARLSRQRAAARSPFKIVIAHKKRCGRDKPWSALAAEAPESARWLPTRLPPRSPSRSPKTCRIKSGSPKSIRVRATFPVRAESTPTDSDAPAFAFAADHPQDSARVARGSHSRVVTFEETTAQSHLAVLSRRSSHSTVFRRAVGSEQPMPITGAEVAS